VSNARSARSSSSVPNRRSASGVNRGSSGWASTNARSFSAASAAGTSTTGFRPITITGAALGFVPVLADDEGVTTTVAPGALPRGAGAGLVAHAPASQIEKATQATRGMPRV
jgi:hypothetical protein